MFDAICAGASGYVLKNTPPAMLLDALGKSRLAERRCRRKSRGASSACSALSSLLLTTRCHLTPQEHALLKLLADGHHRKTAAQELGISVNTVSFHLKHLYEKLQVHSKTEAVAKALREHLL